MEASERGALMLVRFVAAALIGWALIELALHVVVCRQKDLPVELSPCLIKSIPLLVGIIVLVKSRSIAGWISEKLDL